MKEIKAGKKVVVLMGRHKGKSAKVIGKTRVKELNPGWIPLELEDKTVVQIQPEFLK